MLDCKSRCPEFSSEGLSWFASFPEVFPKYRVVQNDGPWKFLIDSWLWTLSPWKVRRGLDEPVHGGGGGGGGRGSVSYVRLVPSFLSLGRPSNMGSPRK